MKTYKGILSSLASVVLMAGCTNETPFVTVTGGTPESTGALKTSCLAPKVTNTEGVEINTRASVPSTGDFNVVITRTNNTRDTSTQGSVEYKYSDMPEVLTLPVGDYKVYAHHGDNKPAAWDEPYYYGESTFGIDANKITDDVDPIVAKLANVRVTIVFHPSLLSAMSGDSNKVEVKVGNKGIMTFAPEESMSAYFKYDENSQTLAATFSGIVDGQDVVESKTYDNVAPGNHYRITFRVRGIDDDKPGTVTGSVTIDTTVENDNKTYTIEGEEETYEKDDLRPNQGGQDEPTPPSDEKAPHAVAMEPSGEYAGFTPVDLDGMNEVTDKLYCAWKIISETEGGFTAFTVDIISDTLTPEELEGVGLDQHLDLINPGEFKEALEGLGFPTGLGGQKEASFDITGFLSLMTVLGEANHEFKMTVTDANGTSVISLRLHTK